MALHHLADPERAHANVFRRDADSEELRKSFLVMILNFPLAYQERFMLEFLQIRTGMG